MAEYITHEQSAEAATCASITWMCRQIYGRNIRAGWWTNHETGEPIKKDTIGALVKLALIHSEVSEAVEGVRKNLMDDKLPHRKMVEVELADAVIRIMDMCGAYGYDLGGAIREKIAYNATREDHKLENRMKPNGKKL